MSFGSPIVAASFDMRCPAWPQAKAFAAMRRRIAGRRRFKGARIVMIGRQMLNGGASQKRNGSANRGAANPMVGARGFEPPTSRSRTVRSNQAELCPGEWMRRAGAKRDADSRRTAQPGQNGTPRGSFRQNRHAIPPETISGRTFIFTADVVPMKLAVDFVSTGM